MTLKDLFTHRVFTISNFLSFSRILLLIPFAWFLLTESWINQYLYQNLFVVVLMILTDFFDGFLARKLGQQSPLGQYLDPVADKVTILVALYLLYLERDYPLWLFIFIFSREAYGSFFGMFLLTKRNTLGKPNLWGKAGVFFISISAALYLIDSPWKTYLDIPVFLIIAAGIFAYSAKYIRTVFNITK